MTFLAGLRVQGIIAPCVIDGPINGPMFLAWVTQFLVPTLRPGDIVVLDNLWAATKATPSGAPFETPAPIASCCRPTAPTSTRSSRPSPSSKRCFEKPTSVPPTLSGNASAHCSIRSAPTNVQPTSSMPAMGQLKPIAL